MATKAILHEGKKIRCPHGSILANVEGKVAWVSPAEFERKTKTKPSPTDPTPEPDDDEDPAPDPDPSPAPKKGGDFW